MRQFLAAIAHVLTAVPLLAQSPGLPNTRQGFWASLGVGAGSTGAECNRCSSDRTTGGSGYIHLGSTVSNKVLLGGESTGWFHSEGGGDGALGFASFVLRWYPSATGRVLPEVRIGTHVLRGPGPRAGPHGHRAPRLVRPGMRDSRGSECLDRPVLNSLASSSVELKVNGTPVPAHDISVTLVQLGVGITLH